MVEIGTGLALLGSAQLVQKLLGPTAEYLGEGIRDFAQKRIRNIQRIFEKATDKLGNNIDKGGAVPPRVLLGVLNEGSFFEDELGSEYFSGVLASSRTSEGKDDRGVTYVKLISRLSNYEIRGHYIFYTVILELYAGLYHSFGLDHRSKMRTLIPTHAFIHAMNIGGSLEAWNAGIISQVMWGLGRENLIQSYSYHKKYIIFSPTVIGAHLYLQAHGKGQNEESALLDPEQSFPKLAGISAPKGAIPLEDFIEQL